MENTFALVIISAFGVLGVFYAATLVVELLYSGECRRVFVVVPVDGCSDSASQVLRFLHDAGPFGQKVVLELSPLGEEGHRLLEKGYCKTILTPEELGPYIEKEYKKQ